MKLRYKVKKPIKGKSWHFEILDSKNNRIDYKGKFKTRTEATREAKERLAEWDEGFRLGKAPASMKLVDIYLEWFKDRKKKNISKKSADDYTYYEKYIKEYFPMALNDITAMYFQQVCDKIGQSVGKNRVQRFRSIIKSSLDYQAMKEMYLKDFTRGVEVISQKKGKSADQKYLQKEDFLSLVKFLSENLDYKHTVANFYLLTVALTGLRPDEAQGLTWENVDLEKNIILVRTAIETKDNIKVPLKNLTSRRTVPIVQDLRKGLLLLKEEQEQSLKLFNYENVENLVFYSLVGNKMHLLDGATYNKQLKRILKKLSITPLITKYGLRHTWVSFLKSEGLETNKIIALMGHANADTFYKVYRHILNIDKEGAITDVQVIKIL